MKKFVFGMLVFLITVVIVIILIVSLSSKNQTISEENLTMNKNDTFQTTPFELLNKEEKLSYLDCQEDMNCFETRFHNCERAYYTVEQTLSVTKYEIIGYKQGFCEIKIRVSNNFGDSGETSCLFDNKKAFSEVIVEPESCEDLDAIKFI